MQRYEWLEKNPVMGEGTYGVVYKAIDQETNTIVAMKKIRLEMKEEGIPATTLREISILRQLKHPNIVNLCDVLQHEGKLFLIFEFLNQDLKRFMDGYDGFLRHDIIQSFSFQLLKGIEYCHTRGVIHRDLKPQNILISERGQLKLADFGLARAFVPPARQFTHEVVTLWYRAPEILLGCKIYAFPIDLWSIGTIIAEIARKKPLFNGDSEIDEIFRIFRVLGTPDELTWPGVTSLQDWNKDFPRWKATCIEKLLNGLPLEGVNLIERLLAIDPRSRATATEALQHEYFTLKL